MCTRLFPGRGRAGARSLWLAPLLAWLALVSLARPDIQEPATSRGKGAREQRRERPASAAAQSAAIDQGGSVEITLRSHGQTGKMVDFLIRSQPVHGSLLGPPQQSSRNTATVTYVHRAEDGAGTDIFTYSVQAPHSAVSAPVPVTIEIRDTLPSVVATPSELDFGTLKVGDTSGADVVFENQGGGEAIGHLEIPAPWTVAGSPDYRLAHGQRQSFRILFNPKNGRSFSETMHFAGDGGAGAHLIGAGIAPAEAIAAAPPVSLSNTPAPPANDAALPQAIPQPAPAASPAAVAAATPSRQSPALPEETAAGEEPAAANSMPLDSSGYITLYDSGVKHLSLRGRGRTTLEIAWQPVTPAPKLYQVELRYLALDANSNLRIDWRPYAAVDMRPGENIVTATVSDLPAETPQTLRVVAIDFAGRLAAASATLQATTLPASTWWRITPLRVLSALLLLCLILEVRRRLETRRTLREMDESRAESQDLMFRP